MQDSGGFIEYRSLIGIGHIFHDLFHTSLCENPDYEVLKSIPIANYNACTWNIDSDHENK